MRNNLCSFFQNGDVVAMIGDSITCDGRWWVRLREELLTQQPEIHCDLRNAGIPGGGAGGALERYPWDIAPMKPSAAFVMFGMNDVWREGYAPGADPERIAARCGCLERFLLSTNALVERLLTDGVRVVLLTPTPFDQYSPERPVPNLPGADDALAICAGMVRGIAAAKHLPLIDLHTPLRQRCAALEPLISEDRVHPGERGHSAMAEILIAALLPGPPGVISPALHSASLALHEAERKQRTIARFRCQAEAAGDGFSDEALRRFLLALKEEEKRPNTLEQIELCLTLLPQQDKLAVEVAQLRLQLDQQRGRKH